jgi:dTDP-4-dehydrorhamnose 3,5-epimerase-like enzyme
MSYKFADFPEAKLIKLNFKINKNINKPTINDVYYKNLVTYVDERGDLTELWSLGWGDKNIAQKVEHVYYNTTHEGIIKGWHVHEHTFSQYTCVKGKMQVVLVDLREDLSTYTVVDEFIIGEINPSYIKIPPGVLKAWKSLDNDSIIVNLLTTADVTDNFKYEPDAILQDIWR